MGGAVPKELGLDRKTLTALGFEGKAGQVLVLAKEPPAVAVGIGNVGTVDAARLRDAAAAFARALPRHASLSTDLADAPGVPSDVAGQAIVEGMLLARYTYDELKSNPSTTRLETINLTANSRAVENVRKGADRGQIFAEAAMLARDLANSPPAYLTAVRMADVATRIAKDTGLKVEVFDEDALVRMGCGGLLGVNAGSTEPPRMIKLTYAPNGGRSARRSGHLTLVGKGIMYDSGGISLKPSDGVHATMKQDMSGAGAILAAMSALKALDCKTAVTGYLMCTDNMPSGSATKLGDVLTIRGGTTVEVMNTDAEGRLVMADALVLAAEEAPDAIVDIATLTGACLRALGPRIAGVFGNNQLLVGQIEASARETDEPVWEFLWSAAIGRS